MLQSLQSIQFSLIQQQETYVMHVNSYERYGEGDSSLFIGTGQEIIEKIKEVFCIDEMDVEDENEEWFDLADERNGDGWDEVNVFFIKKS